MFTEPLIVVGHCLMFLQETFRCIRGGTGFVSRHQNWGAPDVLLDYPLHVQANVADSGLPCPFPFIHSSLCIVWGAENVVKQRHNKKSLRGCKCRSCTARSLSNLSRTCVLFRWTGLYVTCLRKSFTITPYSARSFLRRLKSILILWTPRSWSWSVDSEGALVN